MALIDVSDLLLDPDFTDTVVLVRRASAINGHGEHVMTETSSSVIVSVQAVNTADLVRLPEGARLQDLITVYYRGELQAEAVNGYADVVVWKGHRYQVRTVDEEFMNFGAGFTRAICSMEEVSA